jgi:peptidyl-prolyl cis-trans isomerase SurA
MKTNLIKLLFVVFCTTLVSGAFAQVSSGTKQTKGNDDPVLLTVAGEKITKSEFLTVYNKNNMKKDVIDKKSLEEYLDLYINFKLKVKEAEALGMDTASSFKTELAGYRKQLAQPYLMDKEVNDKLLQEAYSRMQWDIRASHILVKVGPNALPSDTLKAYKKIMDIRDSIVKKGKDFGKMAIAYSDDLSARDQEKTGNRPASKGNAGDLGYFTALDLVYPFETAAYNTKVGEISMPIRTDFGYHLIKVTDRKPAMGKAEAAHILITIPANSTAADSAKYKAKINEIYDKIKGGATFEDMAKQFSDDKASASKGGVIAWFGVNRMVPEFIVAVSKLKKGEISAPVQTMYGWHIIKLVDRKEIAPFDTIKAELKTKIAKDSRANKSKEVMVEKIKKEYGFKDDPKALADFNTVVTDSIFMGKWKAIKAKDLTKNLCSIGNKQFSQQDFAKYLAAHQSSKTNKVDISAYVNSMYKQFIAESAINYEDGMLETKYPEFKSLMKEYRDGILLFELTDEKVWSKAVKDSVGLKEFYDKNKQNYMWDTRLDASIYTCANAKVAKATHKLLKKGTLTNDEILKEINKTSQLDLKIESGKFLKKDNPLIDSIPWVEGTTKDLPKNGSVIFVKVNKVIAKEPKSLAEAKGMVTADYQTYLEKAWIDSLKKKYPVEVNGDVFSTIK